MIGRHGEGDAFLGMDVALGASGAGEVHSAGISHVDWMAHWSARLARPDASARVGYLGERVRRWAGECDQLLGRVMGDLLWGDERSRGGRVVGLLAEWIALAAGAKVMMGSAGLMAQRARLCGVEIGDMPAEEE